MELSRRDFLKLSGAGIGGLALYGVIDVDEVFASPLEIPLRKKIGETLTICPFCGVGCGIIMSVDEDGVVSGEGDPDHPVNQGSLCPKGASLCQCVRNESRLTRVLYRAPGAAEWQEQSWDWAVDRIARKIKDTRDNNWISKNGDGKTVNRTEAIASVGSVFPNNEEAYAITKMQRALGMVYIENESRICISSAVSANNESFGRGPMSNCWTDLQNSDCIMAIGSNPAESFPVGCKWIEKAKLRGGKLIHVDPRYTRTSVQADIYARLRTGTDIAFAGGVIRYIIDDMERNPASYNMQYVVEYTNAALLINPEFKGPAELDGLFSGYDKEKRSYDKSTWQYQLDENGSAKVDKSLSDYNCVFQVMKRHFSRYDDDTVCRITGMPKNGFQEVCRTYAATGAKGKAGAIIVSAGACAHSHGTQNVRSYDIIQLLLGNMGVAGGGVNGIAGAVNGLGCTLQGRLNNWMPGAIPPPSDNQQTLEDYVQGGGNAAYMTSLLKAFYGDNATAANDYGFPWLPKRGGDYSWLPLFEAIDSGEIKGLVCWGMNPAVSGANSNFTRRAMDKLEWMVVMDLWETETASLWKRPGINPASNNTEVFLLPAASSVEKEGSVTNSARWMQWRYKVVDALGDSQDDLWIIDKIMLRLKELYEMEGGPNADAITKLSWDYGDVPDVHKVAKEINGYDLTTGKLLPALTALESDGSTSSGNWIFCGSYTEEGNMAARRDPVDTSGIGLYPNWAWAWPLNRRIWYNRASVDLDGNPYDSEHPVIQWVAGANRWAGDTVDGGTPPINAGGSYPFIMKPPYNQAHLFGTNVVDGPLPEHYEPWESPAANLMSSVPFNPVCDLWETDGKSTPERYPLLATTFRLTEHMLTGSFTRNMPWLVELQPEMFVEMSEELAQERGIQNGSRVRIECARGKVNAIAMVTKRTKPFSMNGHIVHQVAMPWNWGYMGLSQGDSANSLTPRVVDPNSKIPEYRAFLCDIIKV